MQNKKDFDFNFNFDDEFWENGSKSQNNDGFEDIISDTSRANKHRSASHSTSRRKFEDPDPYHFNSSFDINSNYYTGGEDELRENKKGKLSGKGKKPGVFYKIRKRWKCMKKWKKRLIISLTSVLLVFAILVALFFILFRYNYNPITDDPKKLGFKGKIDEDIINIALFGLDSRDTTGKNCFTGNSDSIMILSLNTKTKKVKIISLMRDTLVPIEKDSGLTYYKMNAAYSWGGPVLAIKTINQNFGLDISEYATVNFYGMSDIIDAVGGIDVELTKSEVTSRGKNNHGINDMIQEICVYKDLNPKDYYVTTWGKQRLNGVQAVAYSRIRYCTNIWGTTNDYGRTDRQRFVMEQLFNKAKTLKKSEYLDFAKALIPCTETSLNRKEILSIAYNIMLNSPTFEQYRIPQNTPEMNFLMNSPSGSFGSVVYFDLQYAAKVIKAIIYDDMTIEQYVEQYGIEKNDWYAKVGGSGGHKKPSSDTSSLPSKTEDPTDTKPDDDKDSSEVTSGEKPDKDNNPDDTDNTGDPEEPGESGEPGDPEEPGESGESGETGGTGGSEAGE